jgi:hypothetical protein
MSMDPDMGNKYGKLIRNGETVRVFVMVDNFVPGHVRKILERNGGKIVDATADEFLEDYEKHWGLPDIENDN